jgi:hypothetical protein
LFEIENVAAIAGPGGPFVFCLSSAHGFSQ